MSKEVDYEHKILECLAEHITGLTISDLATKTDISRNTIYRYLGILEGRGDVYNKRVGSYNLYFPMKRSMLYRESITTFLKGLFSKLKDSFPGKEALFKEYGMKIAESITLPFPSKGQEELEKLEGYSLNEILESISIWGPHFNLLFDNVSISDIEIKKANRGIVTFINSEIIDSDNDSIYYFHVMAGIIEKKLGKFTNKKVKCDVFEYKIDPDKEKNYLKYSIKIG
jgi:DNA-binding transcriptional ArsR family regulator